MFKLFSRRNFLVVLLAALASFVLTAEEFDGRSGYRDGIFVSTSNKNFELRLNGRMQTRFEFSHKRNQNKSEFTLSAARLLLKGHAIDPRFTYGLQFGFDQAIPSLHEFWSNFAVLPYDLQLKVGYFIGKYSWLDEIAVAKTSFITSSIAYNRLAPLTGITLHNGKDNALSYSFGIYSEKGVTNFGTAAGHISYNHNRLDATSDADLEGGPLRVLASIGAFSRTRIIDWKWVGINSTIGALMKYENFSANAGMFFGAPLSEGPMKDDIILGAQGQAGYVFNHRYGVAARYAINTGFKTEAKAMHEILGAFSWYAYSNNLKLQLQAGSTIGAARELSPKISTQLQFAF